MTVRSCLVHIIYILLRLAQYIVCDDHGHENHRPGDSDRPFIPLDLDQCEENE
jgi:hypothetical protein